MILYKYRPWNEYTIDIIQNRRIYFPSKAALNDPAELVHPIRFEAKLWDIAFDQVREKISPKTKILSHEIYMKMDRLDLLINRGCLEVLADTDLGMYLAMENIDKHWRMVSGF